MIPASPAAISRYFICLDHVVQLGILLLGSNRLIMSTATVIHLVGEVQFIMAISHCLVWNRGRVFGSGGRSRVLKSGDEVSCVFLVVAAAW